MAGAFDDRELALLGRMLERGLNTPRTSSAGRLFDAVASLAGVRQRARYEGQAAMELEYAAASAGAVASAYRFELSPAVGPGALRWVVDWAPMVASLLSDREAGCPIAVMAARFHRGLADVIAAVAQAVGEPRVALSGGCFQNRLLTELVVARLDEEGFRPVWHQRVPPNDGGVALGQAAAVSWGLAACGASRTQAARRANKTTDK
jgi:hydrogenase maturation protein HypF